MTGTEIIGSLLRSNPLLVAIVPLAQIKAGRLPEGTPLHAIVVNDIDTVERLQLKRGSMVRLTERVSVTVRAGDYDSRTSILKLVRDCCAGWTGNMGDAERIAILNAGKGPGLIGIGDSFEQSQDFRVSYDTPTT